MAIKEHLLGYVSVDELLGVDAAPLLIPDFQRPYSWTPHMAKQLFTDIADSLSSRPEHHYVLGTVILLKREADTHFEVVDGQQRLLTLHLLRVILRGERLTRLEGGDAPVQVAYQELSRQVDALSDEELNSYLNFVDYKTKLLRIVTDDEDEAFQFFDSQNFRGKALRPHDLLKAHHLREMAHASVSEQRAVVEEWERADENDLDRLFSTYLARIHWWSRNLPARAFTPTDIDMFKGVGQATRRLPGAEYHRAAKSLLPGLQEWATPDADAVAQRDLRRAQHQLDAPVAAGRSFFDYAAFMLAECQRLEKALFEPATRSRGGSAHDLTSFRDGARFRFCRELYIAAALHYTNKYSERDLPQVRSALFRWAYAPRLTYERLTWRTVDNYARGHQTRLPVRLNLFATMRDSLDPRHVPLEDVRAPAEAQSRNVEDARLASILQEVG